MTEQLAQKKCQPCEGAGQPFDTQKANAYISEVPGWALDANGKEIHRSFTTLNFMAAIEFINKVAEVAESEDHHPDISLSSYRTLKITLSTHAIGGLSENDFILAAKINELPIKLKG